ncbi:hypothetical protein JOD45_002349 [Scopulibacillus daqui]|uniref:Uncharacterized protein n=1 Tax=Scopulibacillus daqui TaxID=1469162 RepID=A0ABS2Q1E9_9BACL|nr:hypothetical protein [Scopulibacillus daqui]
MVRTLKIKMIYAIVYITSLLKINEIVFCTGVTYFSYYEVMNRGVIM